MPMTFEIIEAAFNEHRKTVTVVDQKPNFQSFSQGYIAGWNAYEEFHKCSMSSEQSASLPASASSPRSR